MATEPTPTIAAIRFGYGLSPLHAAPEPQTLLAGLLADDGMAARHPVPTHRAALAAMDEFATLNGERTQKLPGAAAAFEEARARIGLMRQQALDAAILRALDTPQPFRERLMRFWADHFTVRLGSGAVAATLGSYLYEAIGGNLTGRFTDMLVAVAEHPLMLFYLDQYASVGPGSRLGRKRGRGLNENYARELIELHTLGVGGSYAQEDVRQMAELLTGMFFRNGEGFVFAPSRAEPGAETVLGRDYGENGLDSIHAALDDLATHPDTARHLARKLAVHFVADDPEPDLVATIARAWERSGGDLYEVYGAMLGHGAAWAPVGGKVKQPEDYIVTGLRALGLSGADMTAEDKDLRRHVYRPAAIMGQQFLRGVGPDGFPEAAEAWITPQGLATRIRWSLATPARLVDPLPDPRDFVRTALGSVAGDRLVWAAGRAETRAQGVGLVLASPEFNRR